MGVYNIPRNYKGETRILVIFSVKGLIYTIVGASIGAALFYVLRMFSLTNIGIGCLIVCSLFAFVIGSFKVPEIRYGEFFKKTGGEPIDQVIWRWLKFKMKKKRIYIYKDGGNER